MKYVKLLFTRYLSGKLARGGMAIFAGTMIANVAAYLYHLVVGRILGPNQYGELASLLSLSYIFSVPVTVVQTVLVKYVSILKARSATGEAKQLFLLATKYLSIVVLVGFLGIAVLSPIISNFLHIRNSTNVLWVYAAFGIGFMGVAPVSIILGYQLFGAFAIFSGAGSLLRLASGAFLAPFGVTWTLIGTVMYTSLMYFWMLWPIRSVLASKETKLSLVRRDVISYSIPAFLALLGITMLNQQDVILVKHFFPPHEAGIYSAISILGKVIFFASASIGLVIFPIIAERVEKKQSYQGLVAVSMGLVALCSLCITTAYFLFPVPITTLLYGARYLDAAKYLGIFGLFISFFSLSNLLMNICLAVGKTRIWVVPLAGALVQIVLLNFYHETLMMAAIVNTFVAAGVFVVLSAYYVLDLVSLRRKK